MINSNPLISIWSTWSVRVNTCKQGSRQAVKIRPSINLCLKKLNSNLHHRLINVNIISDCASKRQGHHLHLCCKVLYVKHTANKGCTCIILSDAWQPTVLVDIFKDGFLCFFCFSCLPNVYTQSAASHKLPVSQLRSN